MDLVVLAGGDGSRFGGPKQIKKLNIFGDYLMDYSIYNAIKQGFDRIIFVTNKRCHKVICKKYKKAFGDNVEVFFILQNNDFLKKHNIERKKPIGTGLSVVLAEKYIRGDFCIINSDDLYGEDSLKQAKKFFDKYKNCCGTVAYQLTNTLSEQGAVTRGVCNVLPDGELLALNECVVEKIDGKVRATELSTKNEILVDDTTKVSMNLFCLNKSICQHLKQSFKEFASDKKNLIEKEFFLSTEIQKIAKTHNIKMQVVDTCDKWLGLTYKKDLKMVKQKLALQQKQKLYPKIVHKNFKNLKTSK